MIPTTDIVPKGTPAGWRNLPFWSLFRREKKTGFPDEELLSVYRDYGVIPKSSRDDNHNKESEDLSGYQLVTEGALVTNKMKAWQGSIAISRYRGIVSPAYYVYTPQSDECDQFLHYLLRSDPYIGLYGRISKGVRVNQWDLEHEALRNIPVLLPDLTTQRQIADFLDRETARIDLLIEKKQRLIALLSKKEAGFVGSLFFRGPTQDAILWRRFLVPPVRDGFEIRKLSHLCSLLRDGTHQPPARVDDGFPLLSVRNIVDGIFTLRDDDSKVSERDFRSLCRSFEVRTGDVLLAVVGATLGKSAIVEEMPPVQIQRSLAILRPLANVLEGKFLLLFLRSAFFQELLWSNTSFSAQPGVYLSTLGSFPVVIPNLEKQRELVAAYELNSQILSGIRSKTLDSIHRLKEYRSALITAAVTGQIDVETFAKSGTTDRHLDAIQEEMRV